MKLHHIGYAVQNIDEAIKYFSLLGFKRCSERVEDLLRNVRIQFLEIEGIKIELIEPMNDQSPINNILSKSGPTPYHICMETEKFKDVFLRLKKEGFKPITQVKNAPAITNRNVIFLFRKEIGVIELVDCESE